ncbi:S-Ena type endospore appendage [Bacillus sp. FJAT-52991]|uniref:S-Ena type endospore appendage n=1 Tax=Bacillus kandeliae TaxID=3129297 RepID=A0ABZ2NB95_9BACI
MAKLNCNMNMEEESCCVDDQVCLTVELEDTGTNFTFWEDFSDFVINSTIVVKNNEVGDDQGITATLVINGQPVATIDPGDTKSVTANGIKSLAIQAPSGNPESTVDISFSLHYKF